MNVLGKITTNAAIVFLAAFVFQCSASKRLRNERNRFENNYNTALQGFEKVRAENGELVAKTDAYVLTLNEFKQQNDSLYQELKTLADKKRRVEYITRYETKTVYEHDTSYFYKLTDTTFELAHSDEWIDFKHTVTLDTNKFTLRSDSFRFSSCNKFTLMQETKYKGWWFWKKAVTTNVKILSKNPYTDIDTLFTVKFKK